MEKPITRRGVLIGAVASAAVSITMGNPAHASESTVHDIEIKSFKFAPQHVVAKTGDIIRWTNNDLAPHTATASAFGWDTGEIAKGESAEIIVTDGMETHYFCAFHPHMKGDIEIE